MFSLMFSLTLIAAPCVEPHRMNEFEANAYKTCSVEYQACLNKPGRRCSTYWREAEEDEEGDRDGEVRVRDFVCLVRI